MTAKDGTTWTRMRINDKTPRRNRIVYTQIPGFTNFSKQRIDSTVLSAFLTIFDDSIIKVVCRYSIMEVVAKNDPLDFDKFQILKFIAIILAKGVFFVKK